MTTAHFYWSSTPSANTLGTVWGVWFTDGHGSASWYTNALNYYRVRCVR